MNKVKEFFKNNKKKFFSKNFIIFSIIGIIISYILLTMLSFLFRGPFIIILGLLLGYSLNNLYNKTKKNKN